MVRGVVSSLRRRMDSDRALVMVKSVVAATLAWVVAEVVLGASSSTFAPFSAMLMVHASVARSLEHSVRYAVAMVVGVVVAGTLVLVFPPGWWTFSAAVFVALLVGQWRALGSHGVQVSVAAMFAYAALVQPGGGLFDWAAAGSILGLVLLGCGIAVIVNFALVPPMRYRSAGRNVQTLADRTTDLLAELAETLRDGQVHSGRVEEWSQWAAELPETATQVQQSVEDAAESMRFNPRRRLVRSAPSFEGHRGVARGLQRIADHVRLVVGDLSYFDDPDEENDPDTARLLRCSGDVLAEASEITPLFGELRASEEHRQLAGIDDRIDRARRQCAVLAEAAEPYRHAQPDEWLSCDTLHTDLRRLIEECAATQGDLNRRRSLST